MLPIIPRGFKAKEFYVLSNIEADRYYLHSTPEPNVFIRSR